MSDSELAQLRQTFVEQGEESRRLMGLLIERVDPQIQLVTEGHALQVAKLDSLASVVDTHTVKLERLGTEMAELRADVSELKSDFASHRAENAAEFKETHALIRLSNSELDGRLRRLEPEVGELRVRVDRIEAQSST